jgi:hypothetical protein
MPSRSGHFDSRGKRLRAVMSTVVVAAQAATAFHFVLVRHEYSPETGGFVHVDSASHRRAAVALRPAGSGPVVSSQEQDPEHHPEECSLLGIRREDALAPQASALVLFEDALPSLDVDVAGAPSSTTRFRLAPKQSPPA